MSLRRRVLLGVFAVIVVLVSSNLVLAVAFERHLVSRVDDQLAETANRPLLTRRAQAVGQRDAEPLTDLFIAVANPADGTLTQVGSPLREASPPSIDADALRSRATRATAPLDLFTATSADGDTRWRVASIGGVADGTRLLVIGVNLADVDAALRRARLIQVTGSLAVVAALGAMSWWVLRLGVRPLVTMAGTADQIAAGDLSRRVDVVGERTEAGRLGHAFNTMIDEIEEAFARRTESEERVRQFAADASHELRTPLTSIRGYAELWEAGGLREPDELAEAMRRLSSEAQRMSLLVDDLMLLARLDQHPALDTAPVQFDGLVADAVSDAQAREPERPIDVALSPATVLGDEGSLRQIAANLLANALDHTPAGTPVHVRLDTADDIVRLEVADEGPGVPSAIASQVFERFFRADSSRSRDGRRGGSGLGLSIVRSVAIAHGGSAAATSTPGEGFSVVVELPLAPETTVGDAVVV